MMEYSKFEMVMRPSHVYESKYEYEVSNPTDVFKFATDILELQMMPEEHIYSVSVNIAGDVIGFCEVSKGTIDSSVTGPREVFRTAIMQNAAGILLLHNHPSGRPNLSTEDIEFTKRMVEAGKILGIKVLDHIVVGATDFCSLKVMGYIK